MLAQISERISQHISDLKKLDLIHISYFFFVLLTLTFAMIAFVRAIPMG